MNEFVNKYSDYSGAELWKKKYLLDAAAPVCAFDVADGNNGIKHSTDFTWEMAIGEEKEFTDYPDDHPVKRYELAITYTSAELGLKVVTTVTRYPLYPVVEFESYLYNIADGNSVNVKNVRAVSGDIIAGEGFTVHYNRGTPCTFHDYQPFTCDLSSTDEFSLCEEAGRANNSYMEHFDFENVSGRYGVIAVMSWQGNWSFRAKEKNGSVNIDCGQLETDFVLQKDESVRIPMMVFLYYKNCDWQDGQNIYRRWILQHNLMRHQGIRNYRQNLYFCSSFKSADSDLIGLDQAFEQDFGDFNCTLEYDAGWYEIREGSDWWQDTGNWYPAERYGYDGLAAISEKTRAHGWIYSMWFEPERCQRHTKTAQELTDGAIYFDDDGKYLPYEKAEGGACGLVNYGNKKSFDYILNMLDGYFTRYNIELYRQDYNFDPAGHWHCYDEYQSEQLGIPRKGITENHYETGYLNLWGELVKRHPKLIFDCCAGGGRRYDLATERFGFAHTKSDYWLDEASQQCQNYGFYSWHHFGGTAFTDRDQYDIRTRVTLSVGVDMCEGSDYANTKATVNQWKITQKYILNDFYQLTPYDDTENGLIAMQFNDEEEKEGMLVAYLRNGGSFTFLPRGLDADTVYTLYDEDCKTSRMSATGATLMADGYSVGYENGVKKAVVVWYKKA